MKWKGKEMKAKERSREHRRRVIKAACSTDVFSAVGARNQNAKLPIRHICAPFVVEPLFMCAGALHSEEARSELYS